MELRPVESGVDLPALRTRVKELGIDCFRLDLLPDGRTRVTCWVPGEQANTTQRIEVIAGGESEAVQLALQQAAQSRARHP